MGDDGMSAATSFFNGSAAAAAAAAAATCCRWLHLMFLTLPDTETDRCCWCWWFHRWNNSFHMFSHAVHCSGSSSCVNIHFHKCHKLTTSYSLHDDALRHDLN